MSTTKKRQRIRRAAQRLSMRSETVRANMTASDVDQAVLSAQITAKSFFADAP